VCKGRQGQRSVRPSLTFMVIGVAGVSGSEPKQRKQLRGPFTPCPRVLRTVAFDAPPSARGVTVERPHLRLPFRLRGAPKQET
jgi:hypothetical protein